MNQTTSGATLTKATGGAARIPRMQRYRWESSVSLNPLDGIAGGLINAFAESDQAGTGHNLPGLFTTPGATSLPTITTGLASQIAVNASVDPSQGGHPLLLRDGRISDTANSDYTYNTTGDASYTTRPRCIRGPTHQDRPAARQWNGTPFCGTRRDETH